MNEKRSFCQFCQSDGYRVQPLTVGKEFSIFVDDRGKIVEGVKEKQSFLLCFRHRGVIIDAVKWMNREKADNTFDYVYF